MNTRYCLAHGDEVTATASHGACRHFLCKVCWQRFCSSFVESINQWQAATRLPGSDKQFFCGLCEAPSVPAGDFKLVYEGSEVNVGHKRA